MFLYRNFSFSQLSKICVWGTFSRFIPQKPLMIMQHGMRLPIVEYSARNVTFLSILLTFSIIFSSRKARKNSNILIIVSFLSCNFILFAFRYDLQQFYLNAVILKIFYLTPPPEHRSGPVLYL